jgi:oligopeptide/dipeptide ABC transporter ATP-binding protein
MSVLCELKNLSVDYKVKGRLFGSPKRLSAVSDVSLRIEKGETFALVGESGCGKTTVANAMLGFVQPSRGQIIFDGIKLDKDARKETKRLVRQAMQVVFQDPYSSLNPRFDVKSILTEPLILRGVYDEKVLTARAAELLGRVGLDETDLRRNIFEFSGGQRQRIAIARALATSPKLIVCDEPTSALDVSVHAQICNLLTDLQRELGLAYFFISHNLALVKSISRHMAVMYLGQIVECGLTERIFKNPRHPYTKALFSAILTLEPQKEPGFVLQGEAASPIDAGDGCRFCARCPCAATACGARKSELKKISDDHYAACLY